MAESDLTLPEWEIFIQLIRQCLEEPYSTAYVPLLMREIAFEFITPKSLFSWEFSKTLANENLQAAKFALMISSYVCKAAKVPPEFYEIIQKRLLEIQM